MEHLKKYFFSYTVFLLLLLLVATSLYRFMIARDYIVGYEGLCDPYTQSCFVYCEDEDCTEPFYYSWIERHAGTLFDQCGSRVTECDAAYTCSTDETECSITFCDPALSEDCEVLSRDDADKHTDI